MDRIKNLCKVVDDCWIWVGFVSCANPILRLSQPRKLVSARRHSYETYNAVLVPASHVVTSTCRNNLCVNPAHLTARKRGQHMKLGWAKIEHCDRGHEFSEWNTRTTKAGKRFCIKCDKDHAKLYMAKRRKEQAEHLKNLRIARFKARKKFVDDIKSATGCSSCPEKDPTCLDFHHVDPSTKDDTISTLARNCAPENSILAEMEKCILLCANCHRKLHAAERAAKES